MSTIKKLILLLNNNEYIINDLSDLPTQPIYLVKKNITSDYIHIMGQYMGSSTRLSGGIVYDPTSNIFYKFKLAIIEEMSDNTRNIIVSSEIDFNDIMNKRTVTSPSKFNQRLISDWPLKLKLEINNIEIIFILRQLHRFNNEYQLAGIKYKRL